MTAKFKSKKFRSALQKASKAVLFCLLFAVIFSYTRNVLRNKSESEALGVIMSQSDRSYDVILCGPSHMQYSLQPAQLYGEYGIVSCNTSTAAQSIPTTYYVIKEMLEQHTPKLVVVDLFCLFYPENFFTPTRFHQAVDNFPLGKVKAEAILGLADESKSEFFIDYLLYHGRWKELTEYDYTVLSEYNETYQLLGGTYPYPEPFEPIFDETAEIPEIPLKYLEKIADLCRKNNVSLMFTVIPYRADVDNNDTSAELQQKMYNTAEKLCAEWNVDYFNGLHHLDEIGFDFTADMVEYSHVNASGSSKLTSFYGNMLSEKYSLPDRRSDPDYDFLKDDYAEYLTVLSEYLQY